MSDDLAGTKLDIVLGAIETLRRVGYHGASAREIARVGAFNQALIFYHFGSVQNLMVTALDYVSDRRIDAYKPAFEQASTVPELAALARDIYAADREQGYVTVLAELVAGGMSDRELGRRVFGRIRPWIALVEAKVRHLLAGTPLEAIVPPRDVAFAIVALYLGIDLLSQLIDDHAAAESLLGIGAQYAPMAESLLS
jgi:AcrR family transcriptional regulator